MRVRIDREHVHIERQPEIVRDGEVARARWYVERAVVLELDQHRELVGRLIGEVEADGRLDPLGLAGGLEMDIEREVVAGIETPCQPIGLDPGYAARLPEQEVSVE